MKQFLIKMGLRLSLWLIQKGWNYVDKNQDGKWEMGEVEATAVDLDNLTRNLRRKFKR